MADYRENGFFKLITFALAFVILCGFSSAEGGVDAKVEVDITDVLEENFLGAGVQWSSYPWWDLSEEDWEKVFARVEFMQLPLTRVMLDLFWYCQGFDEKGEPIYTWETSYMKKLYKLLDWCEENGAIVMIGEWGNPAGKDLTLSNEDPRWSRIVCDFIEYMLNEKKYTCLKYYNLINEPHGLWSSTRGNWSVWKVAIENLHKEMERRGLSDKISIASPDADRQWTSKVVNDAEVRNLTGVYDEHWYVFGKEIESGLLELYTLGQMAQIDKKDPGKQFILGELGLLDGKTKDDKQPNVYNFWYGVSMADAAIQMIRGGMSGFMAWDLDDAMHYYGDGGESMNSLSDELPDNAYEKRKVWGFWNIIGAEHGTPEDEQLRPWFYPWSIISRSFPQGCETVWVEGSGIYQLRVAAARISEGKKYHISIAIVNNSDYKRAVKVVVPKVADKVTLGKYEYFDADGDNKVDSWAEVVDGSGKDIFPRATKVLKDVNLSEGVTVKLDSKGVVVLTTIEHSCPVALASCMK